MPHNLILLPADAFRSALTAPRHPAFVSWVPLVYRDFGGAWYPVSEPHRRVADPADTALPLFWGGQVVRGSLARLADVVVHDLDHVRHVEAWLFLRATTLPELEQAVTRLKEYRQGKELGDFLSIPTMPPFTAEINMGVAWGQAPPSFQSVASDATHRAVAALAAGKIPDGLAIHDSYPVFVPKSGRISSNRPNHVRFCAIEQTASDEFLVWPDPPLAGEAELHEAECLEDACLWAVNNGYAIVRIDVWDGPSDDEERNHERRQMGLE